MFFHKKCICTFVSDNFRTSFSFQVVLPYIIGKKGNGVTDCDNNHVAGGQHKNELKRPRFVNPMSARQCSGGRCFSIDQI